MYTPSSQHDDCCSESPITGVLIGALVVVGLAAAAWLFTARRRGCLSDPMSETDKRIGQLERSLHRLQTAINHCTE